jgi:hypothetical protein
VIDHLVFAGSDLDIASRAIAEALGAQPTPGGRHVGHGTRNELLSLGERTYLEIIGPDPEQPAPNGSRPFGVDAQVQPALVAWCARPAHPLSEIVAAARRKNIDFGPIAAMSRMRPDGVLLEWQLTQPVIDGPLRCALPFLIDWGTSPHPTESLAAGVRLTELEIFTPEPETIRVALDIVGPSARCVVYEAGEPALRARITTAHGDVTLSG